MKIQKRIIIKSNTPRHDKTKEKIIELCKRDGTVTSRTLAAYLAPYSESMARKELARCEAEGMIKLVKRGIGGRKYFVLTDSYETKRCEPATSNINNA